MTKLTVRLVKFERAVAMQVLEQKGFGSHKILGHTPWGIQISTFPLIDRKNKIIWLRGKVKKADLDISTLQLNNKREVDKIYLELCLSFKVMAKEKNFKFRQEGEYIYLEGK